MNSTEVQEAVSVIDTALKSKGFARTAKLGNSLAEDPHFICAYTQGTEGGSKLGEPWIYFRDDKLQIIFAEGRIPGHPYNKESSALARFLGDVLRTHYGSKRVEVKYV